MSEIAVTIDASDAVDRLTPDLHLLLDRMWGVIEEAAGTDAADEAMRRALTDAFVLGLRVGAIEMVAHLQAAGAPVAWESIEFRTAQPDG